MHMHAASMHSTINDHIDQCYWLVLVIVCTLDAGLQALLTTNSKLSHVDPCVHVSMET